MRIQLLLTTIIIISTSVNGQPYQQVPIVNDTMAQWEGISYKLINLTPTGPAKSIKKFYLDKIRKDGADAYELQGTKAVSRFKFFKPALQTQDWLKGLSVEFSPSRTRKEWYFVDKNIPADNYDRYKYRVEARKYSKDSCCGCDEADAFAARQVVQYKNGRFIIRNLTLSPLCARQTGTVPIEWYPLVDLAYNALNYITPGDLKEAEFIRNDVIDYDFSLQAGGSFDSVVTSQTTDIGSLIYQEILAGHLKAKNTESGEPIDPRALLFDHMGADTVVDYDDKMEKVLRYRVIQRQVLPSEFSRLRIEQDFYFDFKNEKLFSVVRSVTVLRAIYLPDSKILRGVLPIFRLDYP